ncbi:MAG: hypothetical protein HY909_08030 [Deltaproteobacteria bacterium]|nr:hypothetical protein [Deltaproteobacteria bacterium]
MNRRDPFASPLLATLVLFLVGAFAGCATETLDAPAPAAPPVEGVVVPEPGPAAVGIAPQGVVALPDGPSAATDAGVPDAPPDAPAPSRCAAPVERAITLPSDRLTGRPGRSDPGFSLYSGCRGWDGIGPAFLSADPHTHVYSLRLDRRLGVRIASGRGGWFVAVRRQCDDAATTALCDFVRAELRVVLDAGEYYVLVSSGSSDAAASYDLTVSTFEPEPGAWCETATELRPGAPARAESVALGAGLVSAGCSTLGNPQRYFSVTIPPRSRAFVEVIAHHQENPVPAWSPWRPLLRAFSDCAPAQCLGAAPMALYLDNHRDTPRRVLVSVGSREHPIYGTGSAVLAVRFAPVAEPAVNATCATATTVTDGDALPDQDTDRATELLACGGGSVGRVLFYAATVPAGATLLASVTPSEASSASQVSVRFVEDCATMTCLDTPSVYDASRLAQWTNTGREPRRVVVAVGGVSTTPPLRFALRVAVRAPPVNTSCASALPLRDGDHRTFELLSRGGAGPRCYPGRSRALYYRVAVPPRHRLTVTATPAPASGSLHLALTTACEGTTCLADTFPDWTEGPRRLQYTNDTAEEVTVFVAAVVASRDVGDVAVALAPTGRGG